MKIVIADDHTMVRRGFELLLNYQPDMEVVGTAADGQEAYRLVSKLHPDVVLLDISMPGGESGLVAASRIHVDFPASRIIILTMYDERDYLLYTIQNGASAYVLKNGAEQELLDAIRTVYAGGVYVCKEMVPYLVQGYVQRQKGDDNGFLDLAEREVQVLVLIAKGYGNTEIAERLFLSVKTVESYKSKIMTKLDLHSRPELVEYAIKKKLVQF
ncbi:MAG: response regulator transcription factor [Oscillospiraceae bacterium]|nr:response regulator transcription factor [Oscillospiraceae bacterium]MBQ9411858.1 response regulator transcription factor [Oscillospiraceae bacterium]